MDPNTLEDVAGRLVNALESIADSLKILVELAKESQ